MRLFLISAAGLLLAAPTAASAADAAATFVTKLFASACVSNMGAPDGVRAWARDHNMRRIDARTALEVFVGPGDKGEAWGLVTAFGRFALSIRGQTEGCAAWAPVADPGEVRANLQALVEEAKTSGIVAKVEKDTTEATPWGAARTLAYSLTPPGKPSGFEFTVVTLERPGGAFQATLQVAPAAAD